MSEGSMGWRASALRYIGSPPNVVGSALALVGLVVVRFSGIGRAWPFVIAALYVIGTLLAPRPKMADSGNGFDANEIRTALAHNQRLASGRLPAPVMAKLLEIQREITDLIPMAAQFPAGSQDLFVIQRTATDYLPTTLQAYLALPPQYAATKVVADGKTALQVLTDQLELLDSKMDEITEAAHKQDSDRLLANGRFLEERFGGKSDLALPK
ncbi:MAG: hypothetical protein ABI838_04280 [Chloroflexota bacterium]